MASHLLFGKYGPGANELYEEKQMTASFAYARYTTRAKAEAALEQMFADGDVTEFEFVSITKIGGCWNIMLRIN